MPSRAGPRSGAVVPLVSVLVCVLVCVLAAAGGGYLLGHEGHRSRTPGAGPTPAGATAPGAPPSALAAASVAPTGGASTSTRPPIPVPSAVARLVADAVTDPSLGGQVVAQVVDAATGRVLFDQDSATTVAPASTAKLLTAAALLLVRRPTDRIATRIVAGRPGTIVLVGGGDPTLSAARTGSPTPYPGAARISELAAQLASRHVVVRRIVIDDALFAGPVVSPAWDFGDVPSSFGAAITALMADGGRPTPTALTRSATPALAAAHELAAALGQPHLPVSHGTAPMHAAVLARVVSAPLGELVEQMLQQSDDVIAEMLGRQVAIAEHQPVSFVGAAAAISAVLARHGVQVGTGMLDCSGLASGDRLSMATLVATLRLIVSGRATALRTVLVGLPVAGWSGTLADRFIGTAARAAGQVRAKTGTLTGVNALAGLVHDRSGRLLLFAIDADDTYEVTPTVAEAGLDRFAARLATCGCS
jgi:serine-type D-Ala-D-Ala carboxypeptidase/endopeptidase (penicillin-binding protein 4)